MHIIRFQGGFANQLFQLCMYEKLKEMYGQRSVCADLSFYKTNKDHGGFKLKKWVKLNCCSHVPRNAIVVSEGNLDEQSIIESKTYYYNGYWQDERFFPKDISFLKEFISGEHISDRNKGIYEQVISCNSVSIHVRRGDYVDNYLHGNIANLQYILNAIKFIRSKIAEPYFVVFSDDIEWCEEHLGLSVSDVFYVRGNEQNVEQDMILMSSCKHNIIANSSFSWWAQELNDNPGKMVISPNYWYNEPGYGKGLILSKFIQIENTPEYSKPSESPFFSILIPVYNKEIQLKRCLACVLNQSFDNIEVIIVDDGSTDGSFEVLSEYAKKDARMTILRNVENSSLLASRIVAIKEAHGKYLIFLDSDDYCSTDMCRVIYDRLKDNKLDILEFSYFREPSKELMRDTEPFDSKYYRKLLRDDIEHTVWNKCYLSTMVKESIDVIKPFYCNMLEDLFFVSVFFASAKTFERIEDALVNYVTVSGMSNSGRAEKKAIHNAICSLNNLKDNLESFVSSINISYVDDCRLGLLHTVGRIVDDVKMSNMDTKEKLMCLTEIDAHWETTYEKEFDEDIKKALMVYSKVVTGQKKTKIKHSIYYFLKALYPGIDRFIHN